MFLFALQGTNISHLGQMKSSSKSTVVVGYVSSQGGYSSSHQHGHRKWVFGRWVACLRRGHGIHFQAFRIVGKIVIAVYPGGKTHLCKKSVECFPTKRSKSKVSHWIKHLIPFFILGYVKGRWYFSQPPNPNQIHLRRLTCKVQSFRVCNMYFLSIMAVFGIYVEFWGWKPICGVLAFGKQLFRPGQFLVFKRIHLLQDGPLL